MKWNKTIASTCRYGEIAERIFGDADILWEHSESDYQGFANVLAILPDGTLCHYEWSYGSCSGCDGWESAGLNHDEIEKEMRRDAIFITDIKIMVKYLKHVTKDYKTIEEALLTTWRKHENQNKDSI